MGTGRVCETHVTSATGPSLLPLTGRIRGCAHPHRWLLFFLFFLFSLFKCAVEDMEQEIGLNNCWIVLPPQMSLC